jgi:hypothetical protein
MLLGLAPLVWTRAVTSAAAEETAPAEPAARYPFDPVCSWGRVADGRGMLVRCLEPGEAQRLGRGPERPSDVTSSRQVPALSATVASTPFTDGAPKSGRRVVVKDVGQAVADTGELPEAQRQLRRPLDRYVACVESNGGLSADSGKVTLRFLVRERGRAEGVSVKERSGVSLAAAKCIADVIDRRYVGYPAAPIVGATLSIELGSEGAGR